MVQYLKCCTSTAGDTGLTSGQGTKIIHAMECEGGKNVIFALEIIHGISIEQLIKQRTERILLAILVDGIGFYYHTNPN